MWRTDYGERILEGAEAKVFAKTLLALFDETCQNEQFDDDYCLGVNVFDNLTYGQKISVLSIIGNGLLRKDVPVVELTAILESAIAAVFRHLVNLITFEIDVPDLGTKWREMVVAARKERGGEDILRPTRDDIKEWETEVQCLADGILWDADYGDSHLYIDHPPEKSKLLKNVMRISDNYYSAIADDPNEEEIDTKLTDMRKLCQSAIKT